MPSLLTTASFIAPFSGASLSNMCPEYGATIAIFPPDEETLRYMKSTGRSDEQAELVKKYYIAQEMW